MKGAEESIVCWHIRLPMKKTGRLIMKEAATSIAIIYTTADLGVNEDELGFALPGSRANLFK